MSRARTVGPSGRSSRSRPRSPPRHAADRQARRAEADVRRHGRWLRRAARRTGRGGLGFRLSEGAEAGEAPALVARPPAERLPRRRRAPRPRPPAAARRRAARGALRAARGVAAAAAHRAHACARRSRRRTRRARPDAAAAGPLEVLRRMPEGDVPLAPHLSITFSQPMVALDSHAGARARGGPGAARAAAARRVALGRARARSSSSPRAASRWRREYRVEVPAGTRAATGGTLAARRVLDASRRRRRGSWPATPRAGPRAATRCCSRPSTSASTRRPCSRSLRVRAGGARPAACASPPRPRWRRTRPSRGSPRQREPGRFVAFRAERAAARRRRRRGDGRPGHRLGRGPAPHERPRRRGASAPTAPSACARHECGWSGRCTPFDPWRVELTNPVDAKTLRARTSCASSPSCRASRSRPGATRSRCAALAKGRTTLPRHALERDPRTPSASRSEPGAPLAFAVGPAPAALFAPGGDFVVLDPRAGRACRSTRSTTPSLRVEAYAVRPRTGRPGTRTARRAGATRRATPPGPARDRHDGARRRRAGRARRRRGSTSRRPSTGGLGQVVLVVRPTPSRRRSAAASGVRAWVQATRIGLDAFADGETLSPGRATSPTAGRSAASTLVARRRRTRRRRGDASGLARLALGGRAGAAARGAARHGRRDPPVRRPSWWSEGAGLARAGARATRCASSCSTTARCTARARRCASRAGCAGIGAGPARRRRGAARRRCGGVAWTLRDSQGNEVGQGRRAALSRYGRLRPRAEAAADDEPRHARRCSSRPTGTALAGRESRPRLPGAGVPPARVRGEGRRERGAVRRRRRTPPSPSPPPTTPAARCPAPR